jgi:predicted amino acid racemase
MFLKALRRRNPAFLDAAAALHRSGALPAGTFAIDLDAVRANAAAIAAEGARLRLSVFAMTKQFGRNPDVCAAVRDGGIGSSVAVDLTCAVATHTAGMRVGHLGHLVQIPVGDTAIAASLDPSYWTVFNDGKAGAAAAAAAALGREQRLLARIHAASDVFYPGHEGGYAAADVLAVAERLEGLEGGRFSGITTFPALLFDQVTRSVRPTPNLQTLERAADALRDAGHRIEVNGPGTTSTVTLAALADAGVTQVEPGHALTGTTPLHAIEDLPERPAMCFVTEISHTYQGRAYCFGGGLYVDPVFLPYQVQAWVVPQPGAGRLVDATLPDPSEIDYYGQLDAGDLEVGTTVIFGFRAQAFVTRALTTGISGVTSGDPAVTGVCRAVDGSAVTTVR